jgi:hypothetical protein
MLWICYCRGGKTVATPGGGVAARAGARGRAWTQGEGAGGAPGREKERDSCGINPLFIYGLYQVQIGQQLPQEDM